MLDQLETLLALHKHGTMSKVSSAMRISQSAVSKRISSLESYCGRPLVERSGRNVVLTAEAFVLIERLSPLLNEVREVLEENQPREQKKIVFGISESILSSWGARRIDPVFKRLGLEVEYHCHRSPLVIEKVESGVYDIGFCSGKVTSSRSLISESLSPEEMVLIADSEKKVKKKSQRSSILSIEKSSATWKAIKSEIASRGIKVTEEIESFFSITQLAMSGHGVGLVPMGCAKALGITKPCITSLSPKVFRPIQLVYKKSKLEKEHMEKLIDSLKKVKM